MVVAGLSRKCVRQLFCVGVGLQQVGKILCKLSMAGSILLKLPRANVEVRNNLYVRVFKTLGLAILMLHITIIFELCFRVDNILFVCLFILCTISTFRR